MYVYIDECGDTGFKPNSSKYFILAMVVFKNSKDAETVNAQMAAFKKLKNIKREFKFFKTGHPMKDMFFDALRPRLFDVRAVVIEKRKLQIPVDKWNLTDGQYLYYFALASLMKHYQFNNAEIRLDKNTDKLLVKFMRAHMNFLNQQRPGSIASYSMLDSKKHNLIQLADMVVGAINRSYYPNKTNHFRWRQALRLHRSNIKEMR